MGKNFQTKTEYLDYIETQFSKYFYDAGYLMIPSVNILSKIDKTVDIIGSTISPLKHYIEEDNIPLSGVAMIQNCMKYRSLLNIVDQVPQTFGSYFRGMGVVAKYDLKKIVNDTFNYLLSDNYLGIDSNDLIIRINKEDIDLIKSLDILSDKINVEFNTEDINSYKHIYGMKDITGRNLNIAMRKTGTDIFFDCAAIIVMETPNEKLAIDMGIGNTTLSMCYFNEDNTMASFRIGDLININSIEKMKLSDSITAITVLLNQGILFHKSKNDKKKFKKYILAMNYWKEKLGLKDEDILSIIYRFTELEFKTNLDINENELVKVLKIR